MDVAGKHDMRGAQPRGWRHDALADTGGIDADHRRILEDARTCPLRQCCEAMDIFAAVDLKRLGVIDAVEIAPGLEFGADAIDLPPLDLALEILTDPFQPSNQPFAAID